MAESENKKRKRQANGVSATGNKKVAFENGSGAASIAVSHVANKKSLCPVIASSPGLQPPSISFNAYQNSENSHDVLLHSSQHPRLDYTAVPVTLDAGLAHYTAVFDQKTNKLTIVPAKHLNLRGTLRPDEEEEAAIAHRGMTNLSQREALGREFGTKKAKKAIASKTENAITSNANNKGKGAVDATQTAILDAVGETTAGVVSRETQEMAAFAAKPIPPPNLDATQVEEVYPRHVLIPPSHANLIQIKDLHDNVVNEIAVEFNHRFPAKRVSDIGKSGDLDRLRAIQYIALLLDFHDALSGGRTKKIPPRDTLHNNLSAFPPELVDAVRRRFSSPEGPELGKFHMDRLYTHICALSLYIDGWSTHLSDLRDDLRLDAKRLQQYCQELGCVVKPPTETERTKFKIPKAMATVARIARLRLPLVFPKVSRRRA